MNYIYELPMKVREYECDLQVIFLTTWNRDVQQKSLSHYGSEKGFIYHSTCIYSRTTLTSATSS